MNDAMHTALTASIGAQEGGSLLGGQMTFIGADSEKRRQTKFAPI